VEIEELVDRDRIVEPDAVIEPDGGMELVVDDREGKLADDCKLTATESAESA